jgi:hypothetical protein
VSVGAVTSRAAQITVVGHDYPLRPGQPATRDGRVVLTARADGVAVVRDQAGHIVGVADQDRGPGAGGILAGRRLPSGGSEAAHPGRCGGSKRMATAAAPLPRRLSGMAMAPVMASVAATATAANRPQ